MVLLRCRNLLPCWKIHHLLLRNFYASALATHQILQNELGRVGRLEEARRVFEKMSQRDSITGNSVINGYSRNGQIDDARYLFDIFAGKNVRTWNSFVTGYAKSGRIREARELFDLMPEPNLTRILVAYLKMIKKMSFPGHKAKLKRKRNLKLLS